MSSAGINPLAIYDPETYAKQIAIQRRQALAASLLGAGEKSAGSSPYGGLAQAGKEVLGAFLAKRADQQLGNLYAPQPAQMSQQGGVDPGQISNMPASAPSQSQQVTGPATASIAPGGGIPSGQPQQPFQPPAQPGYTGSDSPPDYASLPPQAKRIYDSIPHIAGVGARQAVNAAMLGGQEWDNYLKAYYTSITPTDLQKNVSAAYGPGSPQAAAAMTGTLAKGYTNTLRPGNMSQDLATGQMTGIPNAQGITPMQMANGQIGMQTAPGSQQAIQGAAYAAGLGAAGAKPATGFDINNQPVATNQAVMANGGLQPNSTANNPLNVQSNGRDIRYSTPTAGVGKAWEVLGSYGQKGINTVSKIVQTWAPQAPPEYAANVSKALGVDPNQPLNMADPNVKGALIDAMRPNESGNQYAPTSQGGQLRPELPPGVQPYLAGQGKDASDRHDATVAAAQESPMRINVLDNIINLSKSGVATGPGQQFQNTILGYAANAPLLAPLMRGQQNNVAKFQELQKFTYQNAIRSWQAAGGTGTDAQMESMAHANPNDQLFPQALQSIAQWGKAAELAVQGKANAQDQFLTQNGQTPTAQIKFENAWRNSFDPKVFQYSLMSPQEKQAFAAQVLKTPQAAKAFLAKQQELKSLGAIQ